MYYEDIKKGDLPNNGIFELSGKETKSVIRFILHKDKQLVQIDTGSNFSMEEVFNFAMVLLKLTTEMEPYVK